MLLNLKSFIPLNGYVLVKEDLRAERSRNGIFIPECAKDKDITGVIVRVADDVKSVKVGEQVMYANSMALKHDVLIGDVRYALILEKYLLAKVEE